MRQALRTIAIRTYFGLLSAVQADRWLQAGHWHGAVLMMHRVRPASADPFQPNRHLEITPDFLDQVLQRLAERRIPVVCLEEAAERVRADRKRERFAVLTLDDGYLDNVEHAWPVMRRHKVPFTVFVATGMLDHTANAWWMALEEMIRRSDRVVLPDGFGRPVAETRSGFAKYRSFEQLVARLWQMGERERDGAIRAMAAANGFDIPAMLGKEMMTWEDVRRLAADPLVTIGGHTISHPALAMLSDAEARAEIDGGLDRLAEETGRRPRVFAYPYGSSRAVSARDIDLVAELGLKVGVTTDRGLLVPGRIDAHSAWPRVSLNGFLQKRRTFDLLLSGVPFMLSDAASRLRRGRGNRPVADAGKAG